MKEGFRGTLGTTLNPPLQRFRCIVFGSSLLTDSSSVFSVCTFCNTKCTFSVSYAFLCILNSDIELIKHSTTQEMNYIYIYSNQYNT